MWDCERTWQSEYDDLLVRPFLGGVVWLRETADGDTGLCFGERNVAIMINAVS